MTSTTPPPSETPHPTPFPSSPATSSSSTVVPQNTTPRARPWRAIDRADSSPARICGEPGPIPPLRNYKLLMQLGKGSFGNVYLARRLVDNAPCAMKVISKPHYRLPIENIKDEVNILAEINHPFIVKMQSAFSNSRYLFIELELVTGGTLQNLLEKVGHLNSNHARFYTGQLVLALDALHRQGIVFRDLKPENVLVDQNGYLKLTDFGLAVKLDSGRCHSPIGTILFMAPEMLCEQPYGCAVDWWALGVTLYCMLFGMFPFQLVLGGESATWDELQGFISHVQDTVTQGFKTPAIAISGECAQFLLCLLSLDPNKRQLDLEKVSSFPWFVNIEFNELLNKGYIAPLLPDTIELPWDPSLPLHETGARDPNLDFMMTLLVGNGTIEENEWEVLAGSPSGNSHNN